MPIHVEIDAKARTVRTTYVGRVRRADVLDYMYEHWESGALDGFDELTDMRRAEFDQLSFADLLSLAQETLKEDRASAGSRLALVVSSPEALQKADFFASARETLPQTGREIRVFESLEEAERWITGEDAV